ncbi:MAG: hypothetical protein EKK37_04375 [Sphingobacteriales bacterium]|jgi:hypothetical protein|nr:MAG: hypothetical protein EKK37_04375 [Sphingobacteriales bacterium]
MDLAIIPECYVDTNLVETLVPPQKQYNHQKGCGTVTKVMKERFENSFAVGVIDKDKKEVDYLKEFNEVGKSEGLILHKHKTRSHYIIQIAPAIELFIFKCLADAGLSAAEFGLPTNLELFRKESKTINSKNDDRFKKLFKALRNAGSIEIQRLSTLIKYLKERNYRADENEIKNLLN